MHCLKINMLSVLKCLIVSPGALLGNSRMGTCSPAVATTSRSLWCPAESAAGVCRQSSIQVSSSAIAHTFIRALHLIHVVTTDNVIIAR